MMIKKGLMVLFVFMVMLIMNKESVALQVCTCGSSYDKDMYAECINEFNKCLNDKEESYLMCLAFAEEQETLCIDTCPGTIFDCLRSCRAQEQELRITCAAWARAAEGECIVDSDECTAVACAVP